MNKTLAAAALSAALAVPAVAQTPADKPLDGDSLTWLAGYRVHTDARGGKIYEAFVGPQNGVVTGTALAANGTYTEYHKLGPGGSENKWGLSVANPRSNMAWTFTPLKVIEKDKVVFQSTDGNLTITYFSKPEGAVGSTVERTANGRTTKTEYDFKVIPAPR